MGIKKTYGSSLRLNISLEGKQIMFNMRIKNAHLQNQFQTENKDVQNALEKHNGFGKLFFLIKKETISEIQHCPTDQTIQVQKDEYSDKITYIPEINDKKPSGKITTVQGIKKWLVEFKGIDESQLNNIEDLKNACETYNVTFPNVKELL